MELLLIFSGYLRVVQAGKLFLILKRGREYWDPSVLVLLDGRNSI
jgi:hypothetical protein